MERTIGGPGPGLAARPGQRSALTAVKKLAHHVAPAAGPFQLAAEPLEDDDGVLERRPCLILAAEPGTR